MELEIVEASPAPLAPLSLIIVRIRTPSGYVFSQSRARADGLGTSPHPSPVAPPLAAALPSASLPPRTCLPSCLRKAERMYLGEAMSVVKKMANSSSLTPAPSAAEVSNWGAERLTKRSTAHMSSTKYS